MTNTPRVGAEWSASAKPFKGHIAEWRREYVTSKDYVIAGRFIDHPTIKGTGFMSIVVKHDIYSNSIETRNSRYSLVGAECKREAA